MDEDEGRVGTRIDGIDGANRSVRAGGRGGGTVGGGGVRKYAPKYPVDVPPCSCLALTEEGDAPPRRRGSGTGGRFRVALSSVPLDWAKEEFEEEEDFEEEYEANGSPDEDELGAGVGAICGLEEERDRELGVGSGM